MKEKICNRCNIKYQVDMYFNDSYTKDGLALICKTCSRNATKAKKETFKNIKG